MGNPTETGTIHHPSKAMPTILRSGPYRFYFYSNERAEPPHVHVQRERFFAKFWLNPVALASSIRFASHELRAIQRIVEDHRNNFLEVWNEHAGD
jgi:hypothetical protein